MRFTKVSFPEGLGSLTQLAVMDVLGRMMENPGDLRRRLDSALDEGGLDLMALGEISQLSDGEYDLTPPTLRRGRFRYNLLVVENRAAILTQTLNPHRRHTAIDRGRDFLRLVKQQTSTVVKTYRVPPDDFIMVPPLKERVLQSFLGRGDAESLYHVIFSTPDDSGDNASIPAPRDLMGVS